MTIADWVTVIALVLGPILGVMIAFFLERQGRERERKDDIFRTLMAYRYETHNPEFIKALNLVVPLFRDNKTVLERVEALRQAFQSGRNGAANEAVTDLLWDLGKSLGFTLERQEVKSVFEIRPVHIDVLQQLNRLQRQVETSQAELDRLQQQIEQFRPPTEDKT